jgi:hypothetical protein
VMVKAPGPGAGAGALETSPHDAAPIARRSIRERVHRFARALFVLLITLVSSGLISARRSLRNPGNTIRRHSCKCQLRAGLRSVETTRESYRKAKGFISPTKGEGESDWYFFMERID